MKKRKVVWTQSQNENLALKARVAELEKELKMRECNSGATLMTKRLDAIRQRLPEPTTNEKCKQDIEYLLSLVEKQRETLLALKHQSHHTIEEEMWRIDKALKCDEGGEVE